MTTTDIVPAYLQRGRLALKEGKSLNEIAEALLDLPEPGAAALTLDARPFPPLPKHLNVTDEHREALARLAEVMNAIEVTERRQMTDAELVATFEERNLLTLIATLLDTRIEAIKEYVRVHMDVRAEESGRAIPRAQTDPATQQVIVAPTQRDKNGHYILSAPQQPERVRIPDTNQEWSQEFRKGSVQIDGSRLLALYEAGEITREQYLAFTREERVYDEDKTRLAIKRDPALLEVLRKITVRTEPGSSLTVRVAG